MRVEELVGQRMRARREAMELTQEQLGTRLGELLGRSWSRQAVSAGEKGDRAFTAAELVAIAFALRTTVGDLLTPTASVAEVEMPAGATLPRDVLVASVLPVLSAQQSYREMQETVVRIGRRLMNANSEMDRVSEDVFLLNDQILQAAHVVNMLGPQDEEPPA